MRRLSPLMTVVLAVSFLSFVSGCSKSNKTSSNRPLTNMSDSDAENAIKERFRADPQLGNSDIKISADTKNNEVKLSGTVNSEEIRDKAIRTAQSTLPKFAVSDTIDVKPKEMARANYDSQQADQERQAAKNRGDHIGDSVEDARIYSQILTKLSGSNLPMQDVRIDVDKGDVTLHGNVGSDREKTEAQNAVQQIQGVKKVDNKLDVSSNSSQRDQNERREGREGPPQNPTR